MYLDERDAQQRFLREASGIELILVNKDGISIKDNPSGQEVLLSLNLLAELALVNDLVINDLLEADCLQASLHFEILHFRLVHRGNLLACGIFGLFCQFI